MRTRPCLTSDDVSKMMAACKAEATKNKWEVSIAIVDQDGNLLEFYRPYDVRPMTAKIAIGKAVTSALTRRPSKEAEDRVKDRVASLKYDGVLPIQGGIPLFHQGECVGAIGASGVQAHEDEQIAKAGAAALG